MKINRIHWRRWLVGLSLVAVAIGAGMVWANHVCLQAAAGEIYTSLEAVPANDVGLVLGTSRMTKQGKPNLHFNQRIEAAAVLYRAGKVRHLLVSGDNHVAGYDEPSDMREALMVAGVPDAAITRDYAGFHTLDSVVRAREVFGVKRFTIITEAFHCPRAVWIARQHGVEAVAFAAPDVASRRWAWRVKAREIVARSWCAVDLYLWHGQPKFLGPKETI